MTGILALLDEHGDAVEFDLIVAGLRLDDLGTKRLSWRDLLIFIKHTPRTSALAQAMHGEAALWGIDQHLLATVIDVLAIGNWQRENEGRKSPTKRPKPVPRPGVEDKDSQKIGKGAIPVKDFLTWWDTN